MGVMVVPPSQRKRTWLVLDELPSLQKLPALETALAEGRKYELATVLGMQSIAQLRTSYGRDGAEAILGQPQTQLFLRLPDPDTAAWASRAIGERHIVREVKGESHGDRTPGSQSTFWQHHIEAAVLPSQIQALPKLEGYLRVADSPEVRRIRLTPVTRPEVAWAFIPSSDDSGSPAVRRSRGAGAVGAPGPAPGPAGVLNMEVAERQGSTPGPAIVTGVHARHPMMLTLLLLATGLLVVQYALGMYVNLYVQVLFESGPWRMMMGSSMMTQPALVWHMMNGFLLFGLTLLIAVGSLVTGNRGLALASWAAWGSVLTAGAGGMGFLMSGGVNGFSYLMAIGALGGLLTLPLASFIAWQ